MTELSIHEGDLIKVDQDFVENVLAKTVLDPTLLQTIHTLKLLGDETATITGIGNVNIEKVFCTYVHVTPIRVGNSLFRGGRGSRIYFRFPEQIIHALKKC